MTEGIVVFIVGVLIVVCLFLVGGAVFDRLRARDVEDHAAERVEAAEELEDRKARHGEVHDVHEGPED